jgi:hypothetical protein
VTHHHDPVLVDDDRLPEPELANRLGDGVHEVARAREGLTTARTVTPS